MLLHDGVILIPESQHILKYGDSVYDILVLYHNANLLLEDVNLVLFVEVVVTIGSSL